MLPWNPIEENKLYHWNEKEGTTNWMLPKSWNDVKTIFLYELSDLGKTLSKEINLVK